MMELTFENLRPDGAPILASDVHHCSLRCDFRISCNAVADDCKMHDQ